MTEPLVSRNGGYWMKEVNVAADSVKPSGLPPARVTTGFAHERSGGGRTVEWYTPPEIFRALNLEFDLDPCAPPLPAASWIPARERYTLPVDGLNEPWEGKVWLNPPYGSETARWMGKLVEHRNGIALVFARVDTVWWQAAAAKASLICLIAGRVRFMPGDREDRDKGSPAAPSSLLAYGMECADALAQSRLGMCFVPELLDAITLPLTGFEEAA